ncbi:MAG: hypothetical protein ABEK16_04600 [Candidatus Nanohalobium sp.]
MTEDVDLTEISHLSGEDSHRVTDTTRFLFPKQTCVDCGLSSHFKMVFKLKECKK